MALQMLKTDGKLGTHAKYSENNICRICLKVINNKNIKYNVCNAWPQEWIGMDNTIADDIEKITRIRINENDAKYICRHCCTKLKGVCQFAHYIRLSNQILVQRGLTRNNTPKEKNEASFIIKEPENQEINKETPISKGVNEQSLKNQEQNDLENFSTKEREKQVLAMQGLGLRAVSNSDLEPTKQTYNIRIRQNIFKDDAAQEAFKVNNKISLNSEATNTPVKINPFSQDQKMQNTNAEGLNLDCPESERQGLVLEKHEKYIKIKNLQELNMNVKNIEKLTIENHTDKKNLEEQNPKELMEKTNQEQNIQTPNSKNEDVLEQNNYGINEHESLEKVQRAMASNDQNIWPLPIQLDKNISKTMAQFDGSVEVKQEVVSEDEVGCQFDENGHVMEIKVEPVEYLESIQISNCHGSAQFESPNQITAKDQRENLEPRLTAEQKNVRVPDGNDVKTTERLEEVKIKEEVPSESEDNSERSDVPLCCLLCTKALRSVSGLKAHVIAQHSYKSVIRKTAAKSTKRRKERTQHACTDCKKEFRTKADLMVHSPCVYESGATCHACGRRHRSREQLARHRPHCRDTRLANYSLRNFLEANLQTDLTEKVIKQENSIDENIKKVVKDQNKDDKLKNIKKENDLEHNFLKCEERLSDNSNSDISASRKCGKYKVSQSKNRGKGNAKSTEKTKQRRLRCELTCQRHCTKKFTPLMRQHITIHYNTLTKAEKSRYVREFTVGSHSSTPKKLYSFEYYLPWCGTKERVCPNFFFRILRIGKTTFYKNIKLPESPEKDEFKRFTPEINNLYLKTYENYKQRVKVEREDGGAAADASDCLTPPTTKPDLKCKECKKEFNNLNALRSHETSHNKNSSAECGAGESDRPIKLEYLEEESEPECDNSASDMVEEFLDEGLLDMCFGLD